MNLIKPFAFWKEEKYRICKDYVNIILIAHVISPRGNINKNQLQCSKTERFSIEEFNEIYQGIVAAGYFVQCVYYNELDFISDYTKNPDNFKRSFIYNLSRNGLGNNKKTIIPSFCELVGLNYSCSSSFTCALCRNKYFFTKLLEEHNICVPKSWLLKYTGEWDKEPPKDGTKVICKPNCESASQGVNQSMIFQASSQNFSKLYGQEYIVQEYIEGAECEVPVFKIGSSLMIFSPVGIELGKNAILDEQISAEYNYNFYSLSNTQLPYTIDKIVSSAKEAFLLLQMNTYGRIDFRINKKGEPYIMDISTTPYTTRHSSFAFAFSKQGFQYSDIYEAVISAALYGKEYQLE